MPRPMIVAIVVTYHPEIPALAALLDAIKGQVDNVVIVDNGSGDEPLRILVGRSESHETFIPLGSNKGIATAQNVGIEWAKEHRAEYVLLLDQDSRPAPDMVAQLLAVVEHKAKLGIAVGGVGPRYVDARRNNPPPFIQVRGLKVNRMPCPCADTVVDVDYLIASGCLIPMPALHTAGNMQDELFIDYVDLEWGMRARRHGFQLFGVCAAKMEHSLGDEPLEFFGRKVPLHSPLRHYYHFRNAVWLYRQQWVPTHWKFADGFRLLLKYGFYTLFAEPRLSHFKMMSLGVWHGLHNRMGMLGNSR